MTVTGRELIRRLVVEGAVSCAPVVTRPRHGGGMVEFQPETIRVIYEMVSGLWVIARVIIRGRRLGGKKNRWSQIVYSNTTLADAPRWVTVFVYPNRPMTDPT